MPDALPIDDDIAAIRRLATRWISAVATSDLAELARLMTDDIVVVHGNGRTLRGREAVLADLATSLAMYRVEQRVETEETVVDRSWAFERARVGTSIVSRAGGEPREVWSHTFTIARKDPADGTWRMARTIGVVEQAGE